MLLPLTLAIGAAPAAAAGNPPVLAVYYAWYDSNTWTSGTTSDLPAALYTSSDSSAIQRQVQQAQSAGINGFELNWWGPGNPTDDNFQKLLDAARPSGFQAALYVDLNGPGFATSSGVISALNYAHKYFNDGAYFHFQGKPFVAFYNTSKFDAGTWTSIFQQVDPNHQVFWMGEGIDFNQLNVFDGIHPFSVAWAENPGAQLASFAAKAAAHPGKVFMP
ncbi:MAG: hypothetical protein JOZ39_02615, partial [Chloroflexi bacterium]|nr:hypothetical protein [Chloroflexota bacterium]